MARRGVSGLSQAVRFLLVEPGEDRSRELFDPLLERGLGQDGEIARAANRRDRVAGSDRADPDLVAVKVGHHVQGQVAGGGRAIGRASCRERVFTAV